MRVVALPADETGCGSYRVIWPAAMVQKAHPDWTVELYRPSDIKTGVDRDGRLAFLQGLDPKGIDVVIMQRIGTPATYALLRWFQDQGTAVVLDADDALWCIHKENAAWKAWNSTQHHWEWMDQAASVADVVTVTTKRLAERYGRHGRVEIIPNRVPAGVTDNPRVDHDGPLRFGWAGYVGTHPADLHVIGNAATRILDDTDAEVLIVGDGQGILGAWNLHDHAARATATGPLPIDLYHAGLAHLDVGLVPLEDSVFNRCKSGLKASELAAVGVPAVVTPTPAHTQLAREGFPLLTAEKPREWFDQVRRLLTQPSFYTDVAGRALEAARTHSMEQHVEEWAATWQRAAARRVRLAG
jgi:glycosyltransferase involved in cell wall biosynthesis